MKLKNKNTGKFDDVEFESRDGIIHGFATSEDGITCMFNYTVKQFCDKWEDVPEEPKAFGWCIDEYNDPEEIGFGFSLEELEHLKEIGLWFKTKEETEKAVEKLKAFKRLKDKGFKFVGWQDSVSDNNPDMALFKIDEFAWERDVCDDLDTVFGGENE